MGFGSSRLASLGGRLPAQRAIQLIQTCLDLGITTIDTADTYGSGDSERMVRKGLGEHRSKAFLMTKSGFPYAALPAFCSPANQLAKKALQWAGAKQNFSRQYLIRSVEKSLKRLGTDCVDAFFLHEPDAGVLREESWEALREIRRAGKSRMTGVSTASVAVLEEGLASGEVQIVQTPVSLQAATSGRILGLCVKFGVPVVANQAAEPAAKLRKSSAWPAFLAANGLGPEQTVPLLLMWASLQKGVVSVLSGTGSVDHLTQNWNSLETRERYRSLCSGLNEVLDDLP